MENVLVRPVTFMLNLMKIQKVLKPENSFMDEDSMKIQ